MDTPKENSSTDTRDVVIPAHVLVKAAHDAFYSSRWKRKPSLQDVVDYRFDNLSQDELLAWKEAAKAVLKVFFEASEIKATMSDSKATTVNV